MSHDAESWAELAEFWAKGGEIPKDFKLVEIPLGEGTALGREQEEPAAPSPPYDHRVTDVANSKNLRKPSDGLGVESEK